MNEENGAASPAEAVKAQVVEPTKQSDAKRGNKSLATAALLMAERSKATLEALAKSETTAAVTPAGTPVVAEQKEETAPPDEKPVETEPAAETEKATVAEDAEGDDVLSNLTDLDDKTRDLLKQSLHRQKEKLHGKFQKRIDEVTAVRHRAEEEANRLRQELATTQSAPPPITQPVISNPNNPLGHIQDIGTLNTEFVQAKDTMRLAEDLLAQAEDAQSDSINYGQKAYTKSELRTAMRNAKRIVEDYAPQQAQYLKTKHEQTQLAYQQFSWWKDRNSPEYVMAQNYLRDADLARRADSHLIAGILVEGFKAIQSRQTAGKASEPAIKSSPKKAPVSQTETSAAMGASRQPEDQLRRSQVTSEVREIEKKRNLNPRDAASLLLKRETLLTKR